MGAASCLGRLISQSLPGSIRATPNCSGWQFSWMNRGYGSVMVSRVYKLARRLFPSSPLWPRLVGRRYLRAMSSRPHGPARQREAVLALSWLERAEELRYERVSRRARGSRAHREELVHLHRLGRVVAPVALEAGQIAKVERYAYDLLRIPELAQEKGVIFNLGSADDPYEAHILLGKVAATRGDMAEADRHLLESIALLTPSNARAISGPDTDLPRALLDGGRNEAVLAYLRRWGEVWTWGRTQLNDWIDQIARGIKPDFSVREYRVPGGRFIRFRTRPYSNVLLRIYRLRRLALLLAIVGLVINRWVVLMGATLWLLLFVISIVVARHDDARRISHG